MGTAMPAMGAAMPAMGMAMPVIGGAGDLSGIGGLGGMGGMMGGMANWGGMGAMGGVGTMAPCAGAMGGIGAMGGMMGGMGGLPMMGMGPLGGVPPQNFMMHMNGGMGTMGGMMGAMGMVPPMAGAMAGAPMSTVMGLAPMPGMPAMPAAAAMGGIPSALGGPSGAVDLESLQKASKDREDALVSAFSQRIQAAASSLSSNGATAETQSSGVGVSKNNPLHPAYRPEGTEPLLGITNRRFVGHIRMFLDEAGYGFIKSLEFEKLWEQTGRPKNDVFFHRNQKGPFSKGDKVDFSVYLNFKGKPQGTDFRKPSGDKDTGDG